VDLIGHFANREHTPPVQETLDLADELTPFVV
jgi:hypothetical protein